MPEVAVRTDWDNPCERFKALQDSYYRLMAGEQEAMIRYRSNEGERELRFQAVNMQALAREMKRAEDECRQSQGLPVRGRRFALQGGAIRRF